MIRAAGIVLAAGESRRMGRAKALLDWRGRTFVETITAVLRESGCDPVVVVLGHHAESIRPAAEAGGAMAAVNPEYPLGQFSSLKVGVAALPVDVAAAVVALVDQPHVAPEVVRALLAGWRESGAPIVRPVWNGRGGHPILLAGPALDEVRRLGPESTTYDVVQQFVTRRHDVSAPDDSILLDFDTPDDLARHRENS